MLSLAKSLLGLAAKCTVFLYTMVSLPIYWLVQRPWERLSAANRVRACRLNPGDPSSPWVRVDTFPNHLVYESITLDEVFLKAAKLFKSRKCLGYRAVLHQEQVISEGKSMTRSTLSDYEWLSYEQVNQKVENLVKAFLVSGVKPQDKVLIYAETRYEWMLTAQAVLRLGATLATLYPSISEEGLVHGINELEVMFIVTSSQLMPKLCKVWESLTPQVARVVYFESYQSAGLTRAELNRIKSTPFSQFIESGHNVPDNFKSCQPTPRDVAIIMYTSGSTGLPKGVILTHRNMVTLLRNLMAFGCHSSEEDVYLACLPLGHIGELVFESIMMAVGVPIGYSSTLTLIDDSPGLSPGTSGDASLLKPTTAFLVPLILERIKKCIVHKMKSNYLNEEMALFAINYKKHWMEKGYKTPLVDKLVCQQFNSLFGGRLRLILSGAAPISAETEDFINYGLNTKIITAYGLTEISSIATIMHPSDLHSQCVGYPAPGAKIRLVNWEEGGYRVTDSPYPRGEVVIGGEGVTSGYFKRKDITDEVYVKEGGETWFYSGDIGEMLPNGVLKIIDRKKDLIKLQDGLYVALGKVETVLKTSKYVENICAYGSGLEKYLVAIVAPNKSLIEAVAVQLKKHMEFKDLCRDQDVTDFYAHQLSILGKSSGLNKREIPEKVTLCSEEWTPDSGLVTAALKIRRRVVYDFYQKHIESMYTRGQQSISPMIKG